MGRLEVYSRFGSFWKFRKVVKCYNRESNDAVASLLYADTFELYFVVRLYMKVMNFHPRSYASLLASRLSENSSNILQLCETSKNF